MKEESEYKDKLTREEYVAMIKKRVKTNLKGWQCLGEIEYENMVPVNEGVFGAEDFLWYNDNPKMNHVLYAIGTSPIYGDVYGISRDWKVTPRQFLTSHISQDQDYGRTGNGNHLVRHIVDRNPRIRLKSWKRWLKPNLDYYHSKIGISEI